MLRRLHLGKATPTLRRTRRTRQVPLCSITPVMFWADRLGGLNAADMAKIQGKLHGRSIRDERADASCPTCSDDST